MLHEFCFLLYPGEANLGAFLKRHLKELSHVKPYGCPYICVNETTAFLRLGLKNKHQLSNGGCCRIFDHTVNPKIALFTGKSVSSCGMSRL